MNGGGNTVHDGAFPKCSREGFIVVLQFASHVTCHVTHGFSLMTRQTEAIAEKQFVMFSSVNEGF